MTCQTSRIVCCQYCGCHVPTRLARLCQDCESWYCAESWPTCHDAHQHGSSQKQAVAVAALIAAIIIVLVAFWIQGGPNV